MVAKLKLTKIGNSVGAIVPKEALVAMGVGPGDTLLLTSAAGGFRLTPYEPGFEDQMDLAQRIMKTRRNTLRALAR